MNNLEKTFEISRIISKKRKGSLNAEEQKTLDAWKNRDARFDATVKDITQSKNLDYSIYDLKQIDTEAALLAVKSRIKSSRNGRIISLLKLSAIIAASIFILAGVMHIFFPSKDNELPKEYANDINPGKNAATLTLANGKKINLTEAKDGPLASEDKIEIVKSADGQLLIKVIDVPVLAAASTNKSATLPAVTAGSAFKEANNLNAMTTPKGGQYHIALADGTNVWINAGSTLKFPSTFQGEKERRVELIGEAYFEVAQVKSVFGMQKRAMKVPFIVKTPKQEVTVLGTHFNINSYADEPDTKTTLLEGSVRVTPIAASQQEADSKAVLLKPGYQTINSGAGIKVLKVDAEDAVAWKKGEFTFRNEELSSIMRKLARWYNVEVIYENKQAGKHILGGTVSRFSKISDVLQILESTGDFHFKVQERRVIVMK